MTKAWFVSIALVVVGLVVCSCSSEPELAQGDWQGLITRLRPLHTPLGEPRPGDWLNVRQEPGQTYAQYRRARPVRPIGQRNKIYVLPIGKMSHEHQDVVAKVVEFMEIYFYTPVVQLEPVLEGEIAQEVQRDARGFGRQLFSKYLMEDVIPVAGTELRKKLEKANQKPDGVAMVALTARDLWSGGDNEFVAGSSDVRRRIAVWSMARNGDPKKDFKQCLRRTLKTVTHETAHVFALSHCTEFECNMGGALSQKEADRQPLHLCAECVAKVCWSCAARPWERYRDLAKLADKYGLEKTAEFFRKSMQAIPELAPKKRE